MFVAALLDDVDARSRGQSTQQTTRVQVLDAALTAGAARILFMLQGKLHMWAAAEVESQLGGRARTCSRGVTVRCPLWQTTLRGSLLREG